MLLSLDRRAVRGMQRVSIREEMMDRGPEIWEWSKDVTGVVFFLCCPVAAPPLNASEIISSLPNTPPPPPPLCLLLAWSASFPSPSSSSSASSRSTPCTPKCSQRVRAKLRCWGGMMYCAGQGRSGVYAGLVTWE